jgi:hypothetical protein
LPPETAAALRAFLQRSETRLSTMHGIAGAFISGAGLLALLPIFFRDAIGNVASVIFFEINGNQFSLHKIAWVIPFAVILSLSLFAFWLLLRQLVWNYFIPHGGPDDLTFFPRLALGAISFAEPSQLGSNSDNSAKRQVLEHLYTEKNIHVVIPHDPDNKERKKLRSVSKRFPRIVPKSRFESIENLKLAIDEDTRQDFGVSVGIASVEDNTLIEEAAALEAALLKTNINLRVIVIRYAKSLIIFVSTAVLIFLMSAAVNQVGASPFVNEYIDTILFVLAVLWLAFTPYLTASPIRWLQSLGRAGAAKGVLHFDPHFWSFESTVYFSCLSAVILSFLAVFFDFGLNSTPLQYKIEEAWSVLCIAFLLWHGFKQNIIVGASKRMFGDLN